MDNICENCTEVKKLGFQIDGLDLVVQKHKVELDAVKQSQLGTDIEHEQMIQNLTTRMDTMTQDIADFKKEVKEDIQGVKSDIATIKSDIPDMFDNAVNKLLAKMFKWMLGVVLVLVAVIILAFTRPVIIKGIDEVRHWVENVEVSK